MALLIPYTRGRGPIRNHQQSVAMGQLSLTFPVISLLFQLHLKMTLNVQKPHLYTK